MAKEYFEKLTGLVEALNIETPSDAPIEINHFFSGAALYAGGKMCASWSPVGLAFKLPEGEVAKLIADGIAKPMKYFPKGHVKKGYVLFENPDDFDNEHWKSYFLEAVQEARSTDDE